MMRMEFLRNLFEVGNIEEQHLFHNAANPVQGENGLFPTDVAIDYVVNNVEEVENDVENLEDQEQANNDNLEGEQVEIDILHVEDQEPSIIIEDGVELVVEQVENVKEQEPADINGDGGDLVVKRITYGPSWVKDYWHYADDKSLYD